MRHHTRGFLAKESGIHRVDHFEWRHDDLPNPLGNRVEPGPYLLDEATVRLLIRCHELDSPSPPRILESWTSGGTEALLEKFRRILNEARTKAIQEDDKVTEETSRRMYSRFTSTIGESGKNQELRAAPPYGPGMMQTLGPIFALWAKWLGPQWSIGTGAAWSRPPPRSCPPFCTRASAS
ncbi:hypothetical protein [Streptomyces alboflavus]|uniref:hypothetical protein n=1 Tax=Streptomyces alboflavus TaxID=67267 RepID=UPI00133199FD|nr:hypothetical protein [Streptomyces alboflavus]